MMYFKAFLIGDDAVAEKYTRNIREAKALGREAKNFDQEV